MVGAFLLIRIATTRAKHAHALVELPACAANQTGAAARHAGRKRLEIARVWRPSRGSSCLTNRLAGLTPSELQDASPVRTIHQRASHRPIVEQIKHGSDH